MVANLEHVDWAEEAAVRQASFHRSLRIASQQRDERPRVQEGHD